MQNIYNDTVNSYLKSHWRFQSREFIRNMKLRKLMVTNNVSFNKKLTHMILVAYIFQLSWVIPSNITGIIFPQQLKWKNTLQASMKQQLPFSYPDNKVHGANVGPIWGRQDPGGPHVGAMNFVIWVYNTSCRYILNQIYQVLYWTRMSY